MGGWAERGHLGSATRWAAVALALLLGAVGCAAGDPSTIEGAPSTTSIPVAGPGGSALGPNATVAPVRPGGPGRPRSSSSVPIVGPAVPTEPQVPEASRSSDSPGANAPVYLRPAGSRRLVVQVLTQAGAEPRQATLDRIVTVLEQVSGKPVSVGGGTVPGSGRTWTDADLEAAADSHEMRQPAGVAVLDVLFLHGRSERGEDVLGITPRADVAAVFSDQVDATATGLVPASTIERSVTVHELGHVLGLVDLFLHTGRADPRHPGHSTNQRSVMYWAVESSLVGDLLTGGPPQDFDAADLADLATIRDG